MDKDEYIICLSDLLNKESKPKEKERRVREANRRLYRATVEPECSNTEADLALAAAAVQEQRR